MITKERRKNVDTSSKTQPGLLLGWKGILSQYPLLESDTIFSYPKWPAIMFIIFWLSKFFFHHKWIKWLSVINSSFMEPLPSANSSSRNENFVSASANLLKNRNWQFYQSYFQDRGRQKASPPSLYQLFSCNFYKRRN